MIPDLVVDTVFGLAFKRSFAVGLLLGITLWGYRAVRLHQQMVAQEGGTDDAPRPPEAVASPPAEQSGVSWWEIY